ncbi:hypothetical protein EN851_22525 [Mesorhizobium sp. M8A.F.Ca.ET.208.01.1.1]|uniref:YciI family protein n=1 Tax=unclassified Mesorhizobium TaxID=325217 RepID=UPI001091C562|nr:MULTISPECIES: YciI family protein [unclassified Mesorhizobium]TGU40058.1 hypothetical protein EN799_06340 [bacterium M00.F.Ca.ET.156.01.1.1]TGV15153.1 hypothetical protein EN816_06935 [Mesorhizobium sp. M8A.F.Ca.ET.173.01.1.1]TGQ89075.1 hypothetical protein EN851_22525 [Mesorhizobium sp. M8A.F.Ca.ET.208.01.1.1]TGR32180.1 hypothetical protein EN845_06340 [Mesorhizobium sp. M8A.F.Ca.ET.202.01.1.1]TGT50395.1 hypothetical protein EN810_22425 [Mesorhizobium sp. M8A.F.Ca.ET.167.01.1.1]
MSTFREAVHASEQESTQGMLGLLVYALLLEKTPLWNEDAGGRIARIGEHIGYYAELERQNKVFLAGPFVDDPDHPDGMILLKVASEAEAHEIAQGDIFHVLKYRTYRVRPWLINKGALDLSVHFSDRSFNLA